MAFVLAHLSDAHIGPLPPAHPRELLGKRFAGYVNWTRGRSHLHDMVFLARLVADIHAQKPDHIAMTGDILNIGLPAEFPVAREWLRTLGNPHAVSFTPGNHDAYTKAVMPLLARTFADWTSDEGTLVSHYPYLRVRGSVALIGLSSAVPTAPFLATGTLGFEQRDAFAALLRQTRQKGLARIVLIHHPPYLAGAARGRNLTDARSFEKIIKAEGAELILHGHNHRQMKAHIAGPDGAVPIYGVASASAIPGTPGHRGAYHLFKVSGYEGAWKIKGRARGLVPGLTEINDLGPL